MKTTLFRTLILAVIPFTVNLPAQSENDEIELTRTVIRAQRQAILSQAMALSEEESTSFWPIYREYLVEVNKLVDREVNLITVYAENYPDLQEETATWILDEFIALERAEADLKASWAPRFREVLSPRRVARFFQLENKMDAIIEYELAASIPLIE